MSVKFGRFMANSGEEKKDIRAENIDLDRLVYDNRERLKELAAINATTAILKKNKSIEETLYEVCALIPLAWQYPEHTVARIRYDETEVTTQEFTETRWFQKQDFESIDGLSGSLEIFSTMSQPADVIRMVMRLTSCVYRLLRSVNVR